MIDVQTHYVPPAAAGILDGPLLKGKVHGLPTLERTRTALWTLDQRLHHMDAAGVEVSVLSFAPIGPIEDRAVSAQLCRAANDGLLQACRSFPDRFVMAATLPLPDTADALAELNRIVDHDHLRAVQIVADTTLYRPDEIGLEQVFATACTAKLPIIIHPTAGAADLSPAFDAFGLASGMHAMVSHALVAARIIQSGMLDQFGDLQLILTHLGGILPFLIERLDSRSTGRTSFPPSHYLKHRLYLDNCGHSAGPALRSALETVGAERLVIGSDWPSRPIEPARDSILGLRLDADAEQAILRSNAARWFDPAQRRRPPASSRGAASPHV